MARWGDIAQWVGPTPNENAGGMLDVLGVIQHIQQGNQAGSIAWCKNPAAQVSAHFFAAKNGTLQQLVDTADRAWAEAAGNSHYLSVEFEGYSGQDLTAGQIQACAKVVAKANREFGAPLVSIDQPGLRGLGWHGMGGDAWGGHPDCPGEPVKALRPVILAHAAVILGQPVPVPPVPARETAPPWSGRVFRLDVEPPIIGSDVLEWQRRMQLRGWAISADSWYGEKSAAVCLAFQRDSTAHNWPLQEDSEVGPLTWAASWERPVSTP